LTSRANIFAVHDRLQFLIAGHMIRSMTEFEGADNHVLLNMRADNIRLGGETWKEAVCLDPLVKGRGLFGGRLKTPLRAVAGILDRYPSSGVFLSGLGGPLDAALASMARRRRGRGVELCGFPGGAHAPSRRDLVGALKGAARSLFEEKAPGPPWGVSAGPMDWERLYSFTPAGAIGGENLVEIPKVRPLLVNTNERGCLFLGHDLGRAVPPGVLRRLSAGAARFTVNLGYRDLCYRPCPREGPDAAEVFAAHGFEITHDARPVEEVFFTRQVACVVSWGSPALASLKLMFGDRVRCISCFSSETARYAGADGRRGRRVQDLFSSCGVELYA
jgi:hypothetical protein